jgi:hypothetical protein
LPFNANDFYKQTEQLEAKEKKKNIDEFKRRQTGF